MMPRISMFVYSEGGFLENNTQGQKLHIINSQHLLQPMFIPDFDNNIKRIIYDKLEARTEAMNDMYKQINSASKRSVKGLINYKGRSIMKEKDTIPKIAAERMISKPYHSKKSISGSIRSRKKLQKTLG